jgi:protein-disulfide isomerase
MKRILPFVIIVIVLVGAVGAAWIFLGSARQPTASTNKTGNSTPDAFPPGAGPPHVRGNPDAKVTLEEFGDFQCPSCGVMYPQIKQIEADYGQRLRVLFREFPLVPNHQNALKAAQAAEAAGLQDHFWEMHDMLYGNQHSWSDSKEVQPIFADYAKQIGLDVDRFNRDLNGEAVQTRIFLDGTRAHAMGVASTPTIFLNGVDTKNAAISAPDLRALIDKALAEAAKP